MREGSGIRQIIRGDKLNFGVVQPCSDDISPDAAEAVNTYFDWHTFPFYGRERIRLEFGKRAAILENKLYHSSRSETRGSMRMARRDGT